MVDVVGELLAHRPVHEGPPSQFPDPLVACLPGLVDQLDEVGGFGVDLSMPMPLENSEPLPTARRSW